MDAGQGGGYGQCGSVRTWAELATAPAGASPSTAMPVSPLTIGTYTHVLPGLNARCGRCHERNFVK
jgi:hypothetical protein